MKSKCPAAFFEGLFNCGAISKQRSEEWHAILKQNANLRSLDVLLDSMHELIARQHVFESQMSRNESHITSVPSCSALRSSILRKMIEIIGTHLMHTKSY